MDRDQIKDSVSYVPSYVNDLKRDDNKYKIVVRTVDNRIMTFHPSEYKEVGSYIEFLDNKSGEIKRFPIVNTEIKVMIE
jgi:hypothetical protein